jgi:ABC-type multidrug transport system fused ATPase/permease subunit
MSPSLLRVQQSFLVMKGSIGAAMPTIELLKSVEDTEPVGESSRITNFDHRNINFTVEAIGLVYGYPDSQRNAIEGISLVIEEGKYVAIVGPSGSGKTTLVDLILGILRPLSGNVQIGGVPPWDLISAQAGLIAYVPQDVMIINGTVRDNIAMGYNSDQFSDADFEDAIKLSQLTHLIDSLPDGLDSVLADKGSNLSGGQRQRIGIARALFTKPKILILDEATSSLDGSTEAGISDSLYSLRGEITVIVIAHRLSSIMNADEIIYIESGKILASGDFDQLRKLVPDFDMHARLMGIV